MCLILFAINPSSRYRLVVAANRDELFARPTRQASFWEDHPSVLAGIDENMGGTWLGVNRQGDFAAVTNFREEPPHPIPPRSRGDLPSHFLVNRPEPEDYLQGVSAAGHEYRGFNLIVANEAACHYYGNRGGSPRKLEDGYYGLSNQLLDCDWPKVIEGRERLKSIDFEKDFGQPDITDTLFDLLANDGDEREFSNSFIRGDTYGTRAASVVMVSTSGEVIFEERNFGEHAEPLGSDRFQFQVSN